MSQQIKAVTTLLEVLENTVMSDHTVAAVRRLIEVWRAEEEAHAKRIATLQVKEQGLCDRVEALKVLRQDLEREIAELRGVYQTQLVTAMHGNGGEWGENHTNFVRAARLLIEPGKKITEQTLLALGLAPPKQKTRPSEHFVRSVATHVLPALGFQIIKSQSAHPDLICRYNGAVIGVEVEVSLRDYNAHRHDAAGAHVLVVWTPPARYELADEGLFRSEYVSGGYSPLLAVVTLQTPALLSSLHTVGKKLPVEDPT